MHPETEVATRSHAARKALLIRLGRALQRALRPSSHIVQRGMTLIEIMVVMALIGIIGTVVAVNVIGAQQEGDEDAARILVTTTVPNALTDYYRRKREFPESLQVLVDQKKLKANQITDPWNTPLLYEPSTTSFRICSAGVDKRPGSPDDICNESD